MIQNPSEIEDLTWQVVRQTTIEANRKCMDCSTFLTRARNFDNVRCWNCLVKLARQKGDTKDADFIIERYL